MCLADREPTFWKINTASTAPGLCLQSPDAFVVARLGSAMPCRLPSGSTTIVLAFPWCSIMLTLCPKAVSARRVGWAHERPSRTMTSGNHW